MPAILRKPTQEELHYEQRFANEDYSSEKSKQFVSDAESLGYSLIPRGNKPLLLLPNGDVIDWDCNLKSLDYLLDLGKEIISEDTICNAGLYFHIVYEKYLKRNNIETEKERI